MSDSTGSMLDVLMNQVGPAILPQASRHVGADEGSTQAALAAALPMLVSALARNSGRPGGEAALASALDRDHDGSVLDDLAGYVEGHQPSAGDGILAHVLGGQRASLERQVAQHSGLDTAQVAKLLALAAPLVLGALSRQRQAQPQSDSGGLFDMLTRERQHVDQRHASGLGGLLTQMLDRDGDGSATDDVLKSAFDMFGRQQ